MIGGTGPVRQTLDDKEITDSQYQNNKQLVEVTFTKATTVGERAFVKSVFFEYVLTLASGAA